jgi:hypothetical protein
MKQMQTTFELYVLIGSNYFECNGEPTYIKQ